MDKIFLLAAWAIFAAVVTALFSPLAQFVTVFLALAGWIAGDAMRSRRWLQ
ncbi:MAG: hypothetical protein HKL99_12925 [Burkholderiales bacterium]|nr:hypothetical protein [Burkholderiales bacterium]